jgi:KDO2-lipid IV(A) lauroyltransferase
VRSFLAVCGRTLSHVLILIPESLRWTLATVVSWVLFDLIRFRRKIVLQNLDIVFPKKTPDEKKSLGRKSLARLIYNFYEFCLFAVIDDSWISTHTKFKGLEHLDGAMKQGKGVLLLSLHLGHGDMAISMLAHRGYPLYVISKLFKVKWLNDFWFGTRQRFGANFLDPHGKSSSFDILRVLKKQGIVIFVLDQYMGPPYGLETTFFGVKTGTAYGLSLFAVKTGAPVLPVWTYRDENGNNIIEIGAAVSVEERASRDETLLATTQKYNYVLENLIQRHPEDWMWIHRRWKKYLSDLPDETSPETSRPSDPNSSKSGPTDVGGR